MAAGQRTMIRLTTALLVAFFLAGPAAARPEIEKQVFQHGEEERSYDLYVPESLADNGVPLLLTFHGSGRDGASIVEKWTKLADRHGFIVAGLDARNPETWRVPDDGPDVIRSLVDSISRAFPIQKRRIYLFGHSGGAVFALRISLLESEYFAAAAVHAGSFRSKGDFEFVRRAIRNIPIKIIVGESDRFFSVASVEETAAAFREQGLPAEVEIIKRHGHGYYRKAKKLNESVWSFLAARELSQDPHFEEYSFSLN